MADTEAEGQSTVDRVVGGQCLPSQRQRVLVVGDANPGAQADFGGLLTGWCQRGEGIPRGGTGQRRGRPRRT